MDWTAVTVLKNEYTRQIEKDGCSIIFTSMSVNTICCCHWVEQYMNFQRYHQIHKLVYVIHTKFDFLPSKSVIDIVYWCFFWMILLPMWTRCWDVWYWFVFCVCNTNGFPFAWFPVQKLRNSGRRRVWQVKSHFWFFTILCLYYVVDKRCIFYNSRLKMYASPSMASWKPFCTE